MRVDAIMTRDIQTATPGDTIQKAAALMDQSMSAHGRYAMAGGYAG